LTLRFLPNPCISLFSIAFSTQLTPSQTIIGNTTTKAVIRSTYFFKLDLTSIIPSSAADVTFVDPIARSFSLYDFYQIGLCSICEGYNGEGMTDCFTPHTP